MPDDSQPASYQDRLLALKLLRENMFYSDPKLYGYTDIAEDLPGAAKAVAPILKNVLPSVAIISRSPQERDEQIEQAIARIKASRKSKGQLLKEVWHNVSHLTPEALKAGAIFGLSLPLLGLRKPWTRNAAGKLRPQLPTEIFGNAKKVFTDPAFRKMLATESLQNAMHAGAYTAGAGAIAPLIAGNYELSDEALQDAKKVMQQQPYLTSLPVSEMMSVLREHRNNQPLSLLDRGKNMAIGAGLGILTGLPGVGINAGIRTLGSLAKNTAGRLAGKVPATGLASVDKFVKNTAGLRDPSLRLSDVLKTTARDSVSQDLQPALRWGAGLGALSGAFSSNVLGDEYENYRPNKT